MKRAVFSIVLVGMLSGCSVRVADLTAISPHNVNLSRVDVDKLPQVKNIEGVDKKPIVFIFPLGQPNLEEAIADALRKGDGDMMTDVTVYQEGWWALLFGERSLRVRGTVVKTRER
ncbi:MAG: hypothetical protein ACK5GN_03030 [Pseudomonadota bacterium]|jgi:hypothetical protein